MQGDEDAPANMATDNAMDGGEDNPVSMEADFAMGEEFVCEFDQESANLRNLRAEDIMGLDFFTDEAAIEWYEKYAKALGFKVRRGDVERNAEGGVKKRTLLCSAQGKRQKTTEPRVREPRPETRFGCNAMFRFSYDRSSNRYRVIKFWKEHSHILTFPCLARYMPSMRKMDEVDKSILRQYKAGGIGPSKAYDTEKNKVGGHAYMGHTKRDAQNQAYRDDLQQITEGDAATALSFLESKRKKDNSFFLEYTLDNENRLEKVFWADSMSIADYSCFGDLLLFDTTYKKNIYNMPLIIFSGINHHYKSCIFACALVQHEKEDNYVWALSTLTKAMGDKTPETVITDEDRSMGNAIKIVFPTSTHRLCSWHLEKNLVVHTKNSDFCKDWKKFLNYDYGSPDKFEEEWAVMVQKHGLEGNTWVDELCGKRTQWARTYLRDVFVAGTKTTSRSEGLNSQLGHYITQKNNLLKFFTQFDIWMEDLREKEIELDYKSIHCSPELRSPALRTLEKSAADKFTFEAFLNVRKELERSSECIKDSKIENGDLHIYELSMYSPTNRSQKVTVDVKAVSVECTCCSFMYSGIPCKHMLFVLKEEKMYEIPDSLVRHCWSKNPKRIETIQPKRMDERQLVAQRYGILQYSSIPIFQLAVRSTPGCKLAQDTFEALGEKLRAMDTGPPEVPKVHIEEKLKGVKNPPPIAYKGSGVKKGTKRTCRNCGGEGHYQKNCPKQQPQ